MMTFYTSTHGPQHLQVSKDMHNIYKHYATDEKSVFWTNVMERHQFVKKNEVAFCNIDNK